MMKRARQKPETRGGYVVTSRCRSCGAPRRCCDLKHADLTQATTPAALKALWDTAWAAQRADAAWLRK